MQTQATPAGKVLADLPLFEEGALSYKVPIYERKKTVYSRYGDWLPWCLILLAFIYIGYAVKQKKEEEISLKSFKLYLLPHRIEWYELLDSVEENYDKIWAIDWNCWDF